MEFMDFEGVKSFGLRLAHGWGCDIALCDALFHSENWDDLRRLSEQASGPGAEHIKEFLTTTFRAIDSLQSKPQPVHTLSSDMRKELREQLRKQLQDKVTQMHQLKPAGLRAEVQRYHPTLYVDATDEQFLQRVLFQCYIDEVFEVS